ncbi:MAG: hypothetical protein UY47_C0004G0054 [Parcubacteria group bacterium GW2011_GWB1_49_7]|nr:MAG: hypothetical protein UX71_C0002G0057 [Parcubacteria group bacterium GW2011_GWA1_47_10]KKW09880.1 MAG: hypothetical protein UY47_C0004G0054 [Parcubacteria group bacterium GW2011_GWB1_49_7]
MGRLEAKVLGLAPRVGWRYLVLVGAGNKLRCEVQSNTGNQCRIEDAPRVNVAGDPLPAVAETLLGLDTEALEDTSCHLDPVGDISGKWLGKIEWFELTSWSTGDA